LSNLAFLNALVRVHDIRDRMGSRLKWFGKKAYVHTFAQQIKENN
jgi:hypothetical protein